MKAPRKIRHKLGGRDHPKMPMQWEHPCDPNDLECLQQLCQKYFEERNEILYYLSSMQQTYGKDNKALKIARELIFGLYWVADPIQSRCREIDDEVKAWRLPDLTATVERLLASGKMIDDAH